VLGHAVLAAGAWLSLIAIGASPYREYVGHSVLGESSVSPPAAVGLFAVGWVLMLLAMMVPGALPGIRLEGRRADGSVHSWLAGTLTPWLLFGFAFGAADLVMHAAIAPRFPAFAVRLPALAWLTAGAYQLALSVMSGRARRVRSATEAPSRAVASPPVRRPRSHAPAARVAFRRGWGRGWLCLRDGWVLMLAASGGHDDLVVMASAMVVMSAPSYLRRPHWFGAASGAALVVVGARLLALTL
jgi:predicted metal-binding membrane protein